MISAWEPAVLALLGAGGAQEEICQSAICASVPRSISMKSLRARIAALESAARGSLEDRKLDLFVEAMSGDA